MNRLVRHCRWFLLLSVWFAIGDGGRAQAATAAAEAAFQEGLQALASAAENTPGVDWEARARASF